MVTIITTLLSLIFLVIKTFLKQIGDYITFRVDQQNVARMLEDRWNYSTCIGAMDGKFLLL